VRFLKGKIDLDADALTALFQECLRAVRAGVHPNLVEWESLELVEQDAFLEANELHEKEVAAWEGIAAQGPEGLRHVISEMDGGAMDSHLLLEEATARAASRMNTRNFATRFTK
jgi:hypothetical protein